MNVFNKYFNKVYVITAEPNGRDRSRIDYIKKLFKHEDIQFDFHYAVNPNYLKDSLLDSYYDYIKAHNIVDPMYTTLNRISCAISHLQVLKQFELSDYDNVLIFEDDVYFEEDYKNKIIKFMDNVPNNWDILNLGRNYTFNETQVSKYNSSVNRIKDLYGAHAYAVSKNKITEFCNFMEKKENLHWGPDPMLIMKYYRESDKCYCPNDYIVGALSEHCKDKNFVKTNECFKSFIS